MFSLDELRSAHDTVRGVVAPSPLLNWPLIDARVGAQVLVKHENHNPTGAFKVRGGLVHGAARAKAGSKGLVSATRGNHGQSLAFAGRRFGLPVTIVVPHGNSVEKNAAMRGLGAELIEDGEDFQAARATAERIARERELDGVPPFHRDLVMGVSTYALEMLTAAPDLDVIYVPIGMGSGVSGCIMARDLLGLKTEIVGVQATGAPCMKRALEAGRPLDLDHADTRADGVATRSVDPHAFEIVRKGVSHVALVDDEAIGAAIRAYWTDTHNLAEGAGAAPLAAALLERDRLKGKRVGLVLSGGNIDLALFRDWVLANPSLS
jgi:threonine dehydratase